MKWNQRDHQVNWHPFTQMKTAPLPIAITRGEGIYLIDEDENSYLDMIASWWVNIHGHSNPYLAERVHQQFLNLEHVIFAGMTHPPAIELSERLLGYLPHYSKVFYSDNGSTAVEVGLKMAFQAWSNQGIRRTTLVAFEDAYHGDTFGAMSASGRSLFNQPFWPFLFEVKFIPAPTPGKEQDSLSALFSLLEGGDVAAFIFEPLVQGAGGMKMHSPAALDQLLDACKRHQVITIADEVMTGFGRTGRMFASRYLQHQADVICLSKAITGGCLPLAATLCTEDIFLCFYADEMEKTLFHGHSYTANPLACAAGLASLDLLEAPTCQERIGSITEHHQQFIQRLGQHPMVRDARSRGTILALELETGGEGGYLSSVRQKIIPFFLKRGILMRPLGNVVYMIPPYVVKDDELNYVYQAIEGGLNQQFQEE